MINKENGRLLSVGPMEQVQAKGGKTFLKRAFLMDATGYDPNTGQRSPYENILQLEVFGERCGDLDRIQAGELITVSFVLQGNRWTDRNGNERRAVNVRCLRVEPADTSQGQQGQQPTQQLPPQAPPNQLPPYGQSAPYQNGQTAPFQNSQLPPSQDRPAAPWQTDWMNNDGRNPNGRC